MLEQSVHISTATRPMDARDIDRILDISRRRNEADGITGILLYHERTFLQVLEGETSRLEACMARVRGDRRHGGLGVLHRAPLVRRDFSRWTMAYVPGDGLDASAREAFVDLRALAADAGDVAAKGVAGLLIKEFLKRAGAQSGQ